MDNGLGGFQQQMITSERGCQTHFTFLDTYSPLLHFTIYISAFIPSYILIEQKTQQYVSVFLHGKNAAVVNVSSLSTQVFGLKS